MGWMMKKGEIHPFSQPISIYYPKAKKKCSFIFFCMYDS